MRKAVGERCAEHGRGKPPRHHRAHRVGQCGEQQERDDDVGEDESDHAVAQTDHENQPDEDGAKRAQERQRGEETRAFVDAKDRERKEEKGAREVVQDQQAIGGRELERAEQQAIDWRRGGQEQQSDGAVRHGDEGGDGSGKRLAFVLGRVLVVEAQKAGVEPPPVDDLEERFAEEQQRQGAVLAWRQHARVERQQQEVDDEHHHVGGAVRKKLPGNPPHVVEHSA